MTMASPSGFGLCLLVLGLVGLAPTPVISFSCPAVLQPRGFHAPFGRQMGVRGVHGGAELFATVPRLRSCVGGLSMIFVPEMSSTGLLSGSALDASPTPFEFSAAGGEEGDVDESREIPRALIASERYSSRDWLWNLRTTFSAPSFKRILSHLLANVLVATLGQILVYLSVFLSTQPFFHLHPPCACDVARL